MSADATTGSPAISKRAPKRNCEMCGRPRYLDDNNLCGSCRAFVDRERTRYDDLSPSLSISAPARALTPIDSPRMNQDDAGADSFQVGTVPARQGPPRGPSQFENLPFASREASHPEEASGRQSRPEASSSKLPPPIDGLAARPAVHEKNENAGPLLLEAPLLSSADQSAMCNDQSSIFNASAPVPKLKRHQLLEGQRRLHFILRARELRAAGQTWDAIARATNIPFSTLIRWEKQAEENRLGRLKSIGHLDFVISHSALSAADCAPQNHKSGRPRKFRLTAAEVAKIKSISLPINRNSTDTSTPEAIRRALASGMFSRSDVGSSDSLCPDRVGPPSAQDILAREANGQPLLTRTMRDQVRLTEMQVRAFRSPNEANLDYIQSPGSLMLTRDELTGEERFFQPGEAYTIDDGSINFGCCVPLERPGDKCWEKFGVIVGRFQFIPVVDHRTRAILGFSYTARPRDSYRAEDLTATMQTVFAEHGMPRVMFLEFGTSDSNLVNDTLRRVGVEPKHVRSPHEKVVEKAFDLLWTKLSSMPGQIGRFRGEMEEENCLLTACKQGHKDPRKYFPSLPQVVAALRQAIAEQNAQWMNSPQYGRWQPGEWFARDARKVTRQLPPQDAWMFSPVITRPLLVRGFCVQTTVPLMPGFSLKFHFSAEFFAEYHGCEVILHFNPFAPECEAMVVCARTGQVLGPAQQINRLARFTRRTFGYGADPDIGHIAARKNAQALHRTVVALKVGTVPARQGPPRGPSGEVAQATAEHRDGLGNLIRAEVGPAASAKRNESAMINDRSSMAPAIDAANDAAEAIAARKATLSRFAQIANQLREDQ